MPLTEMEPGIVEERDKISNRKKKESESRSIQKITDHFKTPEKDMHVVSKQKSLLQFFSKSPATVLNKTDVQEKVFEEKENTHSCNNLVFPQWSANVTDKPIQRTCKEELDFGTNKSIRSQEKNTESLDKSDSVILLSDLSNDTIDTDQCRVDSGENEKVGNGDMQKQKTEDEKCSDESNHKDFRINVDSEAEDVNKAKVKGNSRSNKLKKQGLKKEIPSEGISKDIDTSEVVLPLTEPVQGSNDVSENVVEIKDEETLDVIDSVSSKDSSVKQLKKNTLKGSEMMDLLKEIKNSEKHEKKKKHKHKEKLRSKEEMQIKTEENSDKVTNLNEKTKAISERIPNLETNLNKNIPQKAKLLTVSYVQSSDSELKKKKGKLRKNGVVKSKVSQEKDTVREISYEEFLEKIEEKPEPTEKVVEMSYTEYLQSLENQNEDDAKTDSDKHSEEFTKLIDSENVKVQEDKEEIIKVKDGKIKCETSLNKGIAKFFSKTSTPAKPKEKTSTTKSQNIKKEKSCLKSTDKSKLNKVCKSSNADKLEVDDDLVLERENFLKGSDKTVFPDKTKQATLSFRSAGLGMSKQTSNIEESSVEDKPMVDPPKRRPGRPKKKQAEETKPNIIEKSSLNTTSDSVFETPSRGRKRKKEDSSDFDVSAVSSDSTQETRRSTRKKYKVTAFQMDTNHKTPIKLKLKRCGKSSSSGDEDFRALQQVKMKLSKAQALLEKARIRQQKYKSKLKEVSASDKTGGSKKAPKHATEANAKLEKSDKDTDSTRRSSRLVGKCLPSMEEVSLDNIVISSDDEEGSGAQVIKKRGRPKGSTKALGLSKKETNDSTGKQDLAAKKEGLKNTPKKCKPKANTPKKFSTPKKTSTASPKKSTGTPKKISPKKGKLAPLFLMGKAKTQPASPAKPVLDPEQAKQRQEFLMSGVPQELRKQTASRIAAIVEADYPPLPKENHIQQIPHDTVTDRSWTLSSVELKLRLYKCSDPLLPVSTFSSGIASRCSVQFDLDCFKKFHGHAKLEEGIVEECLNEVVSYNPSYPVHKVYKSLIQNKPTEPTEIVPDPVIVIDEETAPKKRGRRSLKLQKKAEDEKKDPVPVPKKTSESCSGHNLWTEKYCPVKSSEVLGNSTVLKKLKNWLSEWKQLLDKEARKARKLLMKKNKGKVVSKAADADDMWDDDSDFDLDSEDSEDDTSLCNTMLLVGPNGCGKTCSVYALAQELGYKVHEVNASTSRSGRHILSQLQEATQSHQVASSHGCNTPTKKLVSGVLEKPPSTKMSTSFANFFNKKADIKPEVNKKEKKRKRNKSDKDECPDKKRRKKDEDVKKLHMLDNTTQGLSQAVNLTSTTMILFDEVDVFFEEDKGFLSAVQTFMSTTKIPIVLTTSDPGFTSLFDGRYEQLTLRSPPVRSIVSRLQIIALLENLRIDVDKLSELVLFYNKDVRKCLVSLQYMLDSGGSDIQTYRVVQRPGTGSTPLPVINEDSQDCSQESFSGSQTQKSDTRGKEFDDEDDDFVAIKPVATRRKRILEDDSSASVDAFSEMFLQKQRSSGFTNSENDDEARKYPTVHVVGVETCLGMSGESKLRTLDSLVKFLKGECTNQNYLTEVYGVLRQSIHSSIIYNNLPVLLPTAVKVVDSIAKATLDKPCEPVAPKRKRIQEDLYDSEASIDASDIFMAPASDTDKPTEDNNTVDNVDNTMTGNREENLCLSRALSSFASLYDTMSSLDVLETRSSSSVMGRLQGHGGGKLRGRLVSGMENRLPKHHVNTSVDVEDMFELGLEIETRAACRLYKDVDEIQTQVEKLCANNPAFSEEFVLPVLKGSETFRLSNSDALTKPADVSRACDNIQDCIPLVAHKHHRNLHVDYMPTLREICKFEQCRQLTNTKRRFQHYFDSVNFCVKDRTLGVLSTTFL